MDRRIVGQAQHRRSPPSLFFLPLSPPTPTHSQTNHGHHIEPDALQSSHRPRRSSLQSLQGGRDDSSGRRDQPRLFVRPSSRLLLASNALSARFHPVKPSLRLKLTMLCLVSTSSCSSLCTLQASTTKRRKSTSFKNPSLKLVLGRSSFEFELLGFVGVIVSSFVSCKPLLDVRGRERGERAIEQTGSKAKTSSSPNQIPFLLLLFFFTFLSVPLNFKATSGSTVELGTP